MSEPYLGEIKIFSGNFAPVRWALCDGQLLAINANEELYSLIGTTYGGDGNTTFAVPDLRGRVPIHFGTGLGLQPRPFGDRQGTEHVSLGTPNLPLHNHSLQASSATASATSAENAVLAATQLYSDGATNCDLASGSVEQTGGNSPHSNMQPFLCVNFIIAMTGLYPSRS